MSTAQQRGWGNPDAAGYRAKNIVTITLNCGVKLAVHKAVAHLFKGFFDELEAVTGYSLADQGKPDDWGYANRDIRGRPGVKSNHSWGLAVDANAEENPMQSTLKTNMPPETAALAAKWGLRWGANYTGRKDTMHFEFEGTPADVANFPNGSALPKPPPVSAETPIDPPEMEISMLPRCVIWKGAVFLVGYDTNEFTVFGDDDKAKVGTVSIGPWRKTFPNVDRLGQVVEGGGCVTDLRKATKQHPWGEAFVVTQADFDKVFAHRGVA